MKDYIIRLLEDNTYEIVKYIGKDIVVTIPDVIDGIKVSSIGAASFHNCKQVTKFVIPENIETIQDCAFMNCTGIEELLIPSGIKTIGDMAFIGCINLKHLELPDSLESVGKYIFMYCENLEYNIYDNAKYIGNKDNPYLLLAHKKSRDIINCEIYKSCKFIGDNALSGCNYLENIFVPKNVVEIGWDAFSFNRNMKSIIFEKKSKINKINPCTFSNSLDGIIVKTDNKYVTDYYSKNNIKVIK